MPFDPEEIKRQRIIEYQKAAIIGYWRMGAPLHIIAAISGLDLSQIEEIINHHKQTPNESNYYHQRKIIEGR